MPIYVYKCEKCGHIQEEIHPMAGPKYKLTCEKCEADIMVKQVTRAIGRVKGTNNPCPS